MQSVSPMPNIGPWSRKKKEMMEESKPPPPAVPDDSEKWWIHKNITLGNRSRVTIDIWADIVSGGKCNYSRGDLLPMTPVNIADCPDLISMRESQVLNSLRLLAAGNAEIISGKRQVFPGSSMDQPEWSRISKMFNLPGNPAMQYHMICSVPIVSADDMQSGNVTVTDIIRMASANKGVLLRWGGKWGDDPFGGNVVGDPGNPNTYLKRETIKLACLRFSLYTPRKRPYRILSPRERAEKDTRRRIRSIKNCVLFKSHLRGVAFTLIHHHHTLMYGDKYDLYGTYHPDISDWKQSRLVKLVATLYPAVIRGLRKKDKKVKGDTQKTSEVSYFLSRLDYSMGHLNTRCDGVIMQKCLLKHDNPDYRKFGRIMLTVLNRKECP